MSTANDGSTMHGRARRYDLDLVLAADFRASGEVAEIIASHLACLAGSPLQIGLLWLRDPGLPSGAPVHGRIAQLVRRHTAIPIPPESEELTCRLVLVYEPRLLGVGAVPAPRLRADRAVVVLWQSLVRQGALAFDVGAAAAAIETTLAARQLWCPAGSAIRRQCREHAAGLALAPFDLPPFEPVAAWRTQRHLRPNARPVLGRMVRQDDDRLPANRDGVLAAHPAEPGIDMRFLGGEAALGDLVKPLPAAWQILPTDSVGARRFLARLDLYVHFQDEPQRQFPRGALQAMAAGRVAVLGSGFRGMLGAGPAYRDADQVAETARYLVAEPRFYERYVAEQDAGLAERFGPRPFLDLVAEHVRLPRAARSRPVADRRPIVFYPTNGVGLGHVTRLLAIARRMPPACEPIFLTPCHALAVIEHAGYRTEYVPDAAHDETVPAHHHAAMAPRLLAMLRHYDPAAIVFDGNVPRESLLSACADVEAPLIWVRRGMWRADPALARHLALSRGFDAVLEPTEAAAAADRGATKAAADGPLAVPPIMLLDPADLNARKASRAALGLEPDRPAVLVQLGAGNNNDIDRVVDQIAAARRRLDLQIVVAEWLIQHSPVRRRGLRYLAAFPNARHFRAFDFAISAAGYNSFHELMHHGLPTIFVPNDHQKVDDQRARAEWAESRGAAICLPRGAEAALAGYMSALLDPALRRQLARRARAACPTNGAAHAAAAVAAIAERG